MNEAYDSDLLREFAIKGSEAAFERLVARHALVAILASWLPARRATKVDPIVALRYE